jgi:hypothetical protein
LVALVADAVAAVNGKQMGHDGAAHLLLRQGAEVVSTDISNELVEARTSQRSAPGASHAVSQRYPPIPRR